MARRRKRKTTRLVRRSPMLKTARRRRRSKLFGGGSIQLIQPDSMLYGVVRQPISAFVNNTLGQFLPASLSLYADNVGMALISYGVAKFMGGYARKIAIKGLVAENVLAGADIGQSLMGNKQSTSSTQVYG